MNARTESFGAGMLRSRIESNAIVSTSESIPRSDVATMPKSFNRSKEMTNVTIHIQSFTDVHVTSLLNFSLSNGGNPFFQNRYQSQRADENETSKNVIVNGVA